MSEFIFNKLIALILHHAAPTIAGLKPATLINLSTCHDHLYNAWLEQKNQVQGYFSENISFVELAHEINKNIIIFIYHPPKFTAVLTKKATQQYLSTFGYDSSADPTGKLHLLKEKYNRNSYPHEVGVFLGIPVRVS